MLCLRPYFGRNYHVSALKEIESNIGPRLSHGDSSNRGTTWDQCLTQFLSMQKHGKFDQNMVVDRAWNSSKDIESCLSSNPGYKQGNQKRSPKIKLPNPKLHYRHFL